MFAPQQRREASEKQAATTKLLDDGIVTTESAIAAISDETKDILRQFEELLPVVHQTFQKIGCEKMFSEDSINQMNAAAAVVAEGGEAVVATDVTRPVLPPMFAAPSFVQAIRSGITVHNLPMVRCTTSDYDAPLFLLGTCGLWLSRRIQVHVVLVYQ